MSDDLWTVGVWFLCAATLFVPAVLWMLGLW